MNEFTIVIDNWGHKELKDYLITLNGIKDVYIKVGDYLKVNALYDHNIITPKIITMEILLFLDIIKTDSIISFDKHPQFKTSSYEIIREDICCEYCYKKALSTLFKLDGIESVKSNFNLEYLFKSHDKRENISISINYNPKIITKEYLKQIELDLNI